MKAGALSSDSVRDLAVLLMGAALALLWDIADADRVVTGFFGQAGGGFPLREAFITARVLHDGGRLLGWAVVLAWMAYALHPTLPGPPRRERAAWLAVALVSLLLVSALKTVSLTSCPWDLAEFGGHARRVSHWAFGEPDGGPGRCFPSGHASAAFAFVAGYFLVRGTHRRQANAWLAAVIVFGLLFGAAQVARGAHYPSHVIWSAWICWAVCVGTTLGRRLV